ncbi:cytosolic 5'-nucleotidase 1B [Scomber japonicus]|uniref:cytosolic 5'-nucleotidase 1B n=1 Tax=Scomber japonicus TaxID=13676 RepID=UPI0023060353|nr:cytosolic 5'-nucleotidase 1B [Scomber japonicus]
MVSTVLNTDVKQKDADGAMVVAVTSRAVFEAGDDDDEVYGVGVAFTLLQALQRVNQRLLEENPAESLLFDIVLITTDSRQQQQSARIISSTRHYGLEVSRFWFSAEEDFTETLVKHEVQLFVSADRAEVLQASQRGVLSVLLDQQTTSCPSQQLRVLFCGDSVDDDSVATHQAAQRFSERLGELRGRFGVSDSPLRIVLMMSRGGRERCGGALQTLRSRGVSVDEAYCLAGAPRGPILSVLRPHFLLSHTEE